MTTDTITKEAVKAAAENFVAIWDEHFQNYLGKDYPLDEHVVLTTTGKKYWRVVTTVNGVVHGAEAFINVENGDVYFCAGWSGPAKHARGNVLDEDNGLSALQLGGRPHVRYLK